MDFRTILMKAACYDQIDVVKYLITNTNARLFSDIETKPSALCLAIMKNHTNLANYLILQSDCRGNPQDKLSKAVIYACRKRNDDLFYALIEHGVDVNFKWNEETLLIAAVRRGHIELVRSLIALGADIDLRGRFGCISLIFALLDGNPRMLSALLAVGADIHASSTLLHPDHKENALPKNQSPHLFHLKLLRYQLNWPTILQYVNYF